MAAQRKGDAVALDSSGYVQDTQLRGARFVESFAGADIAAKWAAAVTAVNAGTVPPILQFERGASYTITSTWTLPTGKYFQLYGNGARFIAGADNIVMWDQATPISPGTLLFSSTWMWRDLFFEIPSPRVGVTAVRLGRSWRTAGMDNSSNFYTLHWTNVNASGYGQPGFTTAANRIVGFDLPGAQFNRFYGCSGQSLDVLFWVRNDVYTGNPAWAGGGNSNAWYDCNAQSVGTPFLFEHMSDTSAPFEDNSLYNCQLLGSRCNVAVVTTDAAVTAGYRGHVRVVGGAYESTVDASASWSYDYKDGASGSVTIKPGEIYAKNSHVQWVGNRLNHGGQTDTPIIQADGDCQIELEKFQGSTTSGNQNSFLKTTSKDVRVHITGPSVIGRADIPGLSQIDVGAFAGQRITGSTVAQFLSQSRGVSAAQYGAFMTRSDDASNMLHADNYGADGKLVPAGSKFSVNGSVTNDGVFADTNALAGKSRRVTLPTAAGSDGGHMFGSFYTQGTDNLNWDGSQGNAYFLYIAKLVNLSNEEITIHFQLGGTVGAFGDTGYEGGHIDFIIPAANSGRDNWIWHKYLAGPAVRFATPKYWKTNVTSATVQVYWTDRYFTWCAANSDAGLYALKHRFVAGLISGT
jgi:hypothetical protein